MQKEHKPSAETTLGNLIRWWTGNREWHSGRELFKFHGHGEDLCLGSMPRVAGSVLNTGNRGVNTNGLNAQRRRRLI